MRKLLFTTILVVLSVSYLHSQTELLKEDFESYTPGSGLVNEANSEHWVTWNEYTTEQDPLISSEQAYEGVNSVNIVANNDLVFIFDTVSWGNYKLEFYIYINEGKLGYFNLLQQFYESYSDFGSEVYFLADGKGVINSGGDEKEFNYEYNKWIKVDAYINLDYDLATIYLDDKELISWVWSTGTDGTGTSYSKLLNAVDFFGYYDEATGDSTDFYIDNISLSQVELKTGEISSTHEIDNDNVTINWVAPEDVPDGYAIKRNNKILASGLTENTYMDLNVYPGTYTYSIVPSYNHQGYSNPSLADTVSIAGAEARDAVLFEIFTGTWCPYCAGAAMGADELAEEYDDVAIIEYHYGDDYTFEDSYIRGLYYGVDGYPTTEVDGFNSGLGGNATKSIYSAYQPIYEERIGIDAAFTLDVELLTDDESNFTVNITAEDTKKFYDVHLTLHAVLTESNIEEEWQVMSELDYVCRAMYPDAFGTDLDFSTNSVQTHSFNFSVEDYVARNCELVVFLQEEYTKQIIQCKKLDISRYVGVEEDAEQFISITPNPAADHVTIHSTGIGSLEVYNSLGQIILSKDLGNTDELVDVKDLQAGMYIFKVIGNNSVYSRRVIVK